MVPDPSGEIAYSVIQKGATHCKRVCVVGVHDAQSWVACISTFSCVQVQEKQIVLWHCAGEGNMLELCLLTRMETEVIVSYNKSCLGKGGKDTSE